MLNGKPLIIARAPWYRHRFFPWGWYSIMNGDVPMIEGFAAKADGYYEPGDGGEGDFVWNPDFLKPHNQGTVVLPKNPDDFGKLVRWYGAKEQTAPGKSESG